jgi:hypothetical protein
MKNVHRWCYINRNVYNPPHNCSQSTIEEKVLNFPTIVNKLNYLWLELRTTSFCKY